MTARNSGGQWAAEPLTAATDDLAALRSDLQAVARGEGDPETLRQRLADYLTAHQPALEASATQVAEETRRQALEQLYALRGQLRSVRQSAEAARRREESSTDT